MTMNKIIQYFLMYFLGVGAAQILAEVGFNSPVLVTWFMLVFCLSWGFTLGHLKEKELKNEDQNKGEKP